ncbi:unnamed protein product [Brassica oleracea]
MVQHLFVGTSTVERVTFIFQNTFSTLWTIRRPNMITLMGFMFLVTSSLLGYIYSPQLDSPSP